jgi:hypothetical protein
MRVTMSRVAWLGGLGLLAAELAATAVWLPAKAASESQEVAPAPRRAGDHGANLTALQRAVVVLDFGTAARLGEQVARDEAPAATVTHASNERRLQLARMEGELRARAVRLAQAARSGDDATVAEASGALAQTCVRCHRQYLTDGNGETLGQLE